MAKNINIGDVVYTPRFCHVKIKEVFDSRKEAEEQGYKEPTYYEDSSWQILGKSLDMYHMQFAAAKK